MGAATSECQAAWLPEELFDDIAVVPCLPDPRVSEDYKYKKFVSRSHPDKLAFDLNSIGYYGSDLWQSKAKIDAAWLKSSGVLSHKITELSCRGLVVNAPTMQIIVEECPNLEILDLTRAGPGVNKAVAHLTSLENLQYINFSNSFVDELGLSYLPQCRSLRSVRLAAGARLTDASLEHLACCPVLRHLDLSGNAALTEEGLRLLLKSASLETICLRGLAVQGVENFTTMAQLRDLFIF